jgi:CBS domain-containing protein
MNRLETIIKKAVIIPEATTFAEALHTMNTGHTNTLLVVDESGKLCGEVSVSDLFDAIIPTNTSGDQAFAQLEDEAAFKAAVHAAKDTAVAEFMSTDFDTVTPDGSLLEVAAVAIGQGRARIAVVDHDNRPVGIISRSGLKQLLEAYL